MNLNLIFKRPYNGGLWELEIPMYFALEEATTSRDKGYPSTKEMVDMKALYHRSPAIRSNDTVSREGFRNASNGLFYSE